MVGGRKEREALRRRIEEAQWKIARVIRDHGDTYLPVYVHLAAELAKLDAQEDTLAEALRLADMRRPRRQAA